MITMTFAGERVEKMNTPSKISEADPTQYSMTSCNRKKHIVVIA